MSAPVIYGCLGKQLNEWERGFFRDADPFGFILFARNVEERAQIKTLVQDLRACVGRKAPVLIDQEGGRVQRLKPPTWRQGLPAERFGKLAARDLPAARRAVFLNHRLIAADLAELGIDVDCAPVMDLRFPGAHDVIGDRSFGGDPVLVADLARAACDGLLAGGVLPIPKHIPGHGRALVDSHHDLPRCQASRAELEASDFLPFRLLRDQAWAMTAHVVYEAIDAENCATLSKKVIAEVIRGHIGFDGLLLSDDLSMQALSGTLKERAERSLAAGCDIVLHCNGKPEEMSQVQSGLSPMTELALRRGRPSPRAHADFDLAKGLAQLAAFGL